MEQRRREMTGGNRRHGTAAGKLSLVFQTHHRQIIKREVVISDNSSHPQQTDFRNGLVLQKPDLSLAQ